MEIVDERNKELMNCYSKPVITQVIRIQEVKWRKQEKGDKKKRDQEKVTWGGDKKFKKGRKWKLGEEGRNPKNLEKRYQNWINEEKPWPFNACSADLYTIPWCWITLSQIIVSKKSFSRLIIIYNLLVNIDRHYYILKNFPYNIYSQW